MRFIYFDENKYSPDCPYYYVGGFMAPADQLKAIEQTISRIRYNFFGTDVLTKETEIHGKELFHGKGTFKDRKLADRMKLLEDLISLVIDHKLPIRIIQVDVLAHRKKYRYPEPEYHLALMLMLERFCDLLDQEDEFGVVFGDYEEAEMRRAILDFSQFKSAGKTLYGGRPLGRLIDTIHFGHSHYSRFLQLADIIIYLIGRFEHLVSVSEKWHEKKGLEILGRLRLEADFRIQKWP